MTKPVTHGIDHDLFNGLTARQRNALVKLMARIAERAYRRGAQQGAHIAKTAPEEMPPYVSKWRYFKSLDRSPWFDSGYSEPSVDRLFAECGELRGLGFAQKPSRGTAAIEVTPVPKAVAEGPSAPPNESVADFMARLMGIPGRSV